MMANADRELLAEVASSWGFVQKENTSDRFLVTDEEWKEWESFNKRMSEKLLAVVDAFAGRLSQGERQFLESLRGQIAGAKRMTTQELWERRIDQQFDEAELETIRESFDHS